MVVYLKNTCPSIDSLLFHDIILVIISILYIIDIIVKLNIYIAHEEGKGERASLTSPKLAT